MAKVNWKDLGTRTLKTFVAAFVPAAAHVQMMVSNGDYKGAGAALVAAGLAGGAAVITFVWNLLLQYSQSP